MSENNRRFRAYSSRKDYLSSRMAAAGYGPRQITGVLYALAGETVGLNPTAMEKPYKSTGGIGITQWTGIVRRNPRRAQLEAAARDQGKIWTDFEFQVDHLIAELKGLNGHWTGNGRRRFERATSAREAADAVIRDFLRPEKKDVVDKRIAAFKAQEVREPRITFHSASRNPRWGSAMRRTVTSIPRKLVAAVQRLLNLMTGSRLEPDGLWGPKSAAVAKSLGLDTLTAARDWYNKTRDELRDAQRKANAVAGVNLKIDGIWGRNTAAAAKSVGAQNLPEFLAWSKGGRAKSKSPSRRPRKGGVVSTQAKGILV